MSSTARRRGSNSRNDGSSSVTSSTTKGNKRSSNNNNVMRSATSSSASLDDLERSIALMQHGGNTGGCVICKQDNDHAKLMLCEGCNGEYHIYCLNPPLEHVPEDDWFCVKCAPENTEDNLDELVAALPIDYTSRFHEIVWCQGGVGYGWWPACIFNPCLAIGAARTQARKHLGKKHLVYFFYCAEAPFEIKGDATITSWEMGLAMGYHMGRTAYTSGKRRFKQFQLALQAACIEESIPKVRRLKWTFADDSERIAAAAAKKERASGGGSTTASTTNSRSGGGNNRNGGGRSVGGGKPINRDLHRALEDHHYASKPRVGGKRKRGKTDHGATSLSSSSSEDGESGKRRETAAARRRAKTNEPSGREQLFCQVIRRMNEEDVGSDVDVGFVHLPSQKASFADVRRYIKQDLDTIPVEWSWRFWVPGLGALSTRQESKFGSMLAFFWRTSSKAEVGEGTRNDPVRVILVDAPKT